MMEAPCEWELELTALSEVEHWSSLDQKIRDTATALAVEYLWNWTGRKYGSCPATLRPCIQEVVVAPSNFDRAVARPLSGGGLRWLPVNLDGRTLGFACGRCGETACSCSKADALRLPPLVTKVTEVRIGVEVLDPAAYQQVGRILYRRDGRQWPTVQDVAALADDPDVWELDVLYGVPVPAGGQAAAAVLADQFSRALTNSRGCQLPERIQSVSREGVSVAVMDTFEDLQKGGTGIWLVDSWVQSVSRPASAWRVTSPDLRPGRKVSHHRVR